MKYALLASILLFIACQKKESTAPPSLQIQPLADTPTSKSAYELGQVRVSTPCSVLYKQHPHAFLYFTKRFSVFEYMTPP